MNTYSFKGHRPVPLPWRITLPSGFTRTDPSTFTEDELQAAGFTGPYTEPPYDPATQQLTWDGTGYAVEALPPPPPTPDWAAFKAAILSNVSVNAMLATALTSAPAAATALAPTLLLAEQGQVADFRIAWAAVLAAEPLAPDALTDLVALAEQCNLPAEFVAALSP